MTPVYTVGWQIVEQLRAHSDMTKKQALERAIELLAEVGIPDPKSRVNHYPHEFSGGMRQRVVIAMALSCNPKLLIADEPTTALDVTTQAQILDLMGRLQATHGSSIVIITHDMGVIAEIAHRVVVDVRRTSGRDRSRTRRRSRGAPPLHLGTARRGAARRREDPPARDDPRQRRLAARTSRRAVRSPRAVEYRMDVCDERPPLRGANDHLDACWLSDEQRLEDPFDARRCEVSRERRRPLARDRRREDLRVATPGQGACAR